METIERIESKIDKMSDMLATAVAVQAEHERRIGENETSLKPLTQHVSMVQGALKFVGLLATIVGVVATVAHCHG